MTSLRHDKFLRKWAKGGLLAALLMDEEMERMRYYGHPKFYKIMDELRRLHSDKNKQYATVGDPLANFERGGRLIRKMLKPGINPTLAACLCYMAKQVDGIYEIVGEGKTGTVESLHDKLRDTAIYSIIAMIIIGESDACGLLPGIRHGRAAKREPFFTLWKNGLMDGGGQAPVKSKSKGKR